MKQRTDFIHAVECVINQFWMKYAKRPTAIQVHPKILDEIKYALLGVEQYGAKGAWIENQLRITDIMIGGVKLETNNDVPLHKIVAGDIVVDSTYPEGNERGHS